MPWKIIEVPEYAKGVVTISDEELVKLYTLLLYSSSSEQRKLAMRLEHVAKVAEDNLHSHHDWENEGGRCVNGNNHEKKPPASSDHD